MSNALNTYLLDLHTVNWQHVPIDVEVTTPATMHHILVVDCSGSMWGTLDKIRAHLKAKVLELASGGDNTLTLIWFSSSGQYGVALRAVKIATLTNLAEVHRRIDQELYTRGATGFKQPIEEATLLAKELSKTGAVNFFFLSDGMENCWPRTEVIAAVERLQPFVSSATVFEYGTWADRQLLLQMAEKLGGVHAYGKDLPDYQAVVERAVSTPVMLAAKKIELEGPHEGVAVAILADGTSVVLEVRDNQVTAPVGTAHVAWLTGIKGTPGSSTAMPALQTLYHLAAAHSLRGDAQGTRDVLKRIGDVELIDIYTSAFGKEAIWAFAEKARERAKLPGEELAKIGFDPSYMPPADALTIFDVLSLVEDTGWKVVDPEIGYKRIGRAKVDANLRLTPEEVAEVERLSEALKGEKDVAKVAELAAKIDALTNKPAPLRFVDDETPETPTFSVEDVVTNEDRPNISIRVRRPGTVDISSRIPDELKDKIPAIFPTYVWRTYTLVRDGFINMPTLTIQGTDLSLVKALEEATKTRRLREGAYSTMPISVQAVAAIDLDLTKIPLINLLQLQKPDPRAVAEAQADLLSLQAAVKVAKHKLSELKPEKSLSFAALYGEDGAKFLASIGITDGGFHPRVLQTESTDVYVARVLELKVKGFSSLPSVAKVREQIQTKRLTPVGKLMAPAVAEFDKYTAAPESITALETVVKGLRRSVAKTQRQLARLKYPALVGGAWFFSSFDEKEIELNFSRHPDLKTTMTFDLKEVEEKI